MGTSNRANIKPKTFNLTQYQILNIKFQISLLNEHYQQTTT